MMGVMISKENLLYNEVKQTGQSTAWGKRHAPDWTPAKVQVDNGHLCISLVVLRYCLRRSSWRVSACAMLSKETTDSMLIGELVQTGHFTEPPDR